ncbi:hypothetical protein AB0H73_06020 [Streptomyces olivoreticuli]
MDRINVTENGMIIGWFDLDAATQYDGLSSRDALGENSTALLRTKGGRWVLGHFSSYMRNGTEVDNIRYAFLNDEQAKKWLIEQSLDDVVERYFGDLEPESGPNLGGRPAVGPKVETRLPATLLDEVTAYAAKYNYDRATALRKLIEAGIRSETSAQQ